MKQRIKVSVAGMTFFVVTDDGQEYTEMIAKTVNSRINSLVLATTNCTKMKAAAICAMDYCSEASQLRDKCAELEKRVKRLERELAVQATGAIKPERTGE